MKKGILKKVGLPLAVVLVGVLVAVPVMAGENDYTRVSNILKADVGVLDDDEQVELMWAITEVAGDFPGEEAFDIDHLDLPLVVGDSFYIWVRAENVSGSELERVLFLIATDDGFTIERTDAVWPENGEPDWTGELPYEEEWGAYRYGPSAGFTMPTPYTAYSEFKGTADVPGVYEVDVYAVQLDE